MDHYRSLGYDDEMLVSVSRRRFTSIFKLRIRLRGPIMRSRRVAGWIRIHWHTIGALREYINTMHTKSHSRAPKEAASRGIELLWRRRFHWSAMRNKLLLSLFKLEFNFTNEYLHLIFVISALCGCSLVQIFSQRQYTPLDAIVVSAMVSVKIPRSETRENLFPIRL